MKSIKIILYCILLCGNFFIANAQYIAVDDTKSGQELVENILINSSCANVSNINISGDLSSVGANSYGYFSSGTSNFPFSEGIILSTWSSTNSEGPFIKTRGGGASDWHGDIDLDQSLGIQSTNATSIEFDFTPLTNFLSFNYIFASNEYQDYFPCQFSDGFAFLLKEKGSEANYENIAVLPETLTFVSSTNVHPLIENFNTPEGIIPGCPAINQNYFNGFNSFNSPTNYSGQTVVLTAQTNVIAGKTYHIKLVIADDKEEYYDSAVFLEAGSFSSKINLGEDRLLANNNPVCYGENLILDTQLPATNTYKWYKDNIEIPLETGPTYQVIASGNYKVEVAFSAGCSVSEAIKVEYTLEIILKNTTLVQCDDDGDNLTTYNLTNADLTIKNGISGLSDATYYESLAEAQTQINPILNPTFYKNKTPNQRLFARVSNSLGCPNFATVDLTISNLVVPNQNPISTCDDDTDGIYSFNLDEQVSPQILNGLTTGLIVAYYSNEIDAVLEKNTLPNRFNNTIPNQQIIFARIINGSDCFQIIPITLIVNTFSPSNFGDETVTLCSGSTVNLTVDIGFSSYLWNTGSTSNTISITAPGNYSVAVTDINGCEKTKSHTVKSSGVATITGVQINDFSGNENSVLIEYSGIGDYEFSLDGFYYQNSPSFEEVPAGSYLAYVRDKNGCGLSPPLAFYVMDYPKFFTPNGDGFNDFWKIKNLNLFPNAELNIFDRYGKLLNQLNISNNGWDGTFNGLALPSDDYWFQLIIDDKTIKGHFSLKK
jgi:gliding motility-associated-like protein